MPIQINGLASASVFNTTGDSASKGKLPTLPDTLSRTSLAAASTSLVTTNSIVTSDLSSLLLEVICLTPSIPLTDSSIICVT